MEEWRHLAVGDPFHRQVDLAQALRLGGDRVAPLRGVAVVGRKADVVVLTRAMGAPIRERERERLDVRGLRPDRLQGAELPLEETLH